MDEDEAAAEAGGLDAAASRRSVDATAPRFDVLSRRTWSLEGLSSLRPPLEEPVEGEVEWPEETAPDAAEDAGFEAEEEAASSEVTAVLRA